MSIKTSILSDSSLQTEQLGKKLAKEILKSSLRKRATIIGLEGDLGGGKTTFLQGFARGLGIKKKITSPTFVIMRKFQVSGKFQAFYHIDCYRIEKQEELLTLGFEKIISDPKNIICIEWADKVKKILPEQTLWIKFKFKDKNKREISFNFWYTKK